MSRLLCLSALLAALGSVVASSNSAQESWLLMPDRVFDGTEMHAGWSERTATGGV